MPGVRWLSPRESRAWRGWLTLSRALDRGIDRELIRESGLSAADYQLLVPLSESPDGALRPRDLGREVDWERSRLSHQLRRMEQRGLVERSECPTDARGMVIVLTSAGRRAIESAAPAHVEWVRAHFIDMLSEQELDTLITVSDRILGQFAEGVADCGDSDCGDSGLCDAENGPAYSSLEPASLSDDVTPECPGP